MNRNIASALFAVATIAAGQAYAAPDAYEPTAVTFGTPRAAAEVRLEAAQAAKLIGSIVGADTLVKYTNAPATRNREQVRIEALQAAHTPTHVLASPQ